MTWFAASVIVAYRVVDNPTNPILVHENIYLVEGVDAIEALQKAEKYGHEEASVNDGLTLNDLPARAKFVGVRKLINISNPAPYNMDEVPPSEGTEITYSEYEVCDEKTLEQLANGEEVIVRYLK